jgi:anti-sigma factor ChrR (cupin superfamily)
MIVAMKSNTSFSGLALGGWRDLTFEYFRPGIDVHWLMTGDTSEPTVAVLKYAAGSRVPRHRHVGLETIVVMDGTQSDESGDYPTGTVILNPPGSEHSVWTDQGCVVLIQWDKPITFVEPER